MAGDTSTEVYCKIAYCGPTSSGKSANLRAISAGVPAGARGELSALVVGDGAAHIEFIPLDMGMVRGRRVRFHVYSAPTRPGLETDRVSILSGVDGIVFVADSHKDRFRQNLLSYQELEIITRELGMDLGKTPLVMQYNKRDVKEAVPVSALNARLNASGRSYVEASAITGAGVLNTLRAVSRQVLERLQ